MGASLDAARKKNITTEQPQKPPHTSPQALQNWWENTGRISNAPSILGNAAVSAKGSGVFLLKHLVESGVLDARRFATPASFLVASDAVSRVKPVQIQSIAERKDVISAFSRSRIIGQSLLHARNALKIDPRHTVMVRSLGLAEGSVGQSAAGIYKSETCIASLAELRNAAERVVVSSFSAPVLTLNREFGLPDAYPGLLIQPKLRGIHCIFHTSRPGQVSTVITGENDRFPVHEPIGSLDDAQFSGMAAPRAVRELVHEAAAVLSDNGRIPIECEMMYLPDRKVAAMLQLRFVTPLNAQSFPQGLHAIAETNSVIGANTIKEQWIVDMTKGDSDSLAALWVIQKHLRLQGVTSYAVLVNAITLSSLWYKERYKLSETFAPLRLGSTFVEYDGSRAHALDPDSHALRLAYDKGRALMYMNFDVAAFRDEKTDEVRADPSLWNDEDELFVNPSFGSYVRDLSNCGVRCYRTKRPVLFVADENNTRGAIYL